MVRGFAIFYDAEGQPLDTVPIGYKGNIPAQTAKRIKGEVDPSVPRLSESLWVWDDSNRKWRKLDDPTHLLDMPRKAKTEVRKGRVEFRILDFAVANE